VADLIAGWRHRPVVYGALAALVMLLLIGSTVIQTSQWRNSSTLWTHTVAVTRSNALAHYNLGVAYVSRGKAEEAIAHLGEALRIDPLLVPARINLGNLLSLRGKREEAIAQFREILRIKPGNADAHNNLGIALASQGKINGAITHFREALRANRWSKATRHWPSRPGSDLLFTKRARLTISGSPETFSGAPAVL
jgi:tetratricopeptide (TPR) repeat protein